MMPQSAHRKTDQVLVVPTRTILGLDYVVRFTKDVDRYLPFIFDPASVKFMDRKRAENSPSYRQIIPYVVLRSGDDVFTYRRSGASGEQRLAGLLSIGVGGHVQASDLSGQSIRNAYTTAMHREVQEEVDVESDYSDRMVAVINDASTPVGRVHLGILHEWRLAQPRVVAREATILEARFAPIASLRNNYMELEIWSQIALDALIS